MGILERLFGNANSSNDPFSLIQFDRSSLQLYGKNEDTQIWICPGDCAVQLHYGNGPPGLLESAPSLEAFTADYSKRLKPDNCQLIDLKIVLIDGCKGITVVTKVPLDPRGYKYFGLIVIPFSHSRYMFTIQTEETGMTGHREALLFEVKAREGLVEYCENGDVKLKYDSDNSEFDSMFEQHPLSRVRRHTARILGSIRLDNKIRKLRPFPLPSS